MNVPTSERLQTVRCPIKQQHLDHVLAARDPLDDVQMWERCFKNKGVDFDTCTRVMRIISDVLEVDLPRVRARDDFTKELSFLWDLDSLADLKIMHALQEEFKITISDAEAEAMKTLRDIVVGVYGKINMRA